MRLILVTGGARSGKSDYAERHAVEPGGTDAVLLDGLTLLASNAPLSVASESGREVGENAVHAALAATEREGRLLVVINEIGFGVVPPTPLGRWFRDALGAANRRLAAAANVVVLLVSGVPLRIKGRASLPNSASP